MVLENKRKNISLCWYCKKSLTSECSWQKDFTPVFGWDAYKTHKRTSMGESFSSYHVNDCPEFERG